MNFIKKYRFPLVILSLGIVFRLLFAFFFHHLFDYIYILTLVKSVADTGNLTEGFLVVKKVFNYFQLFGKIYYQIAALWLIVLDKIRLVDIRYLFDNKPYQMGTPYMTGLMQWSPLLYQLTAIKLIQFLYDGIYLFFLIKITSLLYPKNDRVLTLTLLFWAFNPFLVFTAYAGFQSDLAMISFLLAGFYFALKAFKTKTTALFTADKFVAFVFFAVGAVIKHVPLLFFPLFAVLFATNFFSFMLYTLTFFATYVLFSQPWAADAVLIKRFFLASEESLALFRFNLNSVPVFMFIYLAFLSFIVFFKQKIISQAGNIIKIATLLLTIIYLCEESGNLFLQFNTWILPFIFFLSLDDPKWALFFVAPIIGFYKRAIVDNAVMIGALAASFGSPLYNSFKYEDMLSNIINPSLIQWLLNTLMIFVYIVLAFMLVSDLTVGRQLEKLKTWLETFNKFLDLKKTVLAIFILFFLIAAGDFALRSRFVKMTDIEYQTTTNIILSKKPITVEINNPFMHPITGITGEIKIDGQGNAGYLTFEFFDKDTKKLLTKKNVNNITLLDLKKNIYNITLDHAVNARHITLKITDPFQTNTISLVGTKIEKINDDKNLYNGLDNFYTKNDIVLKFANQPFVLNLLGSYGIGDIANNLTRHIFMKPTFFIGYFTAIAGLLVVGVVLFFLH